MGGDAVHGVWCGVGGPIAALYVCAGTPAASYRISLMLVGGGRVNSSTLVWLTWTSRQQRPLPSSPRLQMGAPDEGWPLVEVKQEQKASEEAIQEVLAAARLGSASPARGEGSAEGSQLGSPSTGADPPAAAMEE